MIRELRRFGVKDAADNNYTVVEIAGFLHVNGCEVPDGVPTLFTSTGLEVSPTPQAGSYWIDRLAVEVSEV